MLPGRTFAFLLLAGVLSVSYRASAQDDPSVTPLPLPAEKPPAPPSGEPEPLEPLPETPPAQPVQPARAELVPPPPPPPSERRPAAREEMRSHEATDNWNGLLGPFQIGPVVGAGLPSLLNFGVAIKLTHYVGAGINIGIIPTLKISYYGQATLAYQEYDVYARVYPFGGAFFLGTGLGYEAVQGTLATTVDLTPYQQGLPAGLLPNSVDYASQGSVKTLVLTPQIGLFHTFRSGFSLGFDVGLQVPIAPSQVTLKSQANFLADPQIPEATRQQLNNQYVKPTDDQVRSTLETIGRTIIPTFNVRIGWLI
jgi:hypothetical protein